MQQKLFEIIDLNYNIPEQKQVTFPKLLSSLKEIEKKNNGLNIYSLSIIVSDNDLDICYLSLEDFLNDFNLSNVFFLNFEDDILEKLWQIRLD